MMQGITISSSSIDEMFNNVVHMVVIKRISHHSGSIDFEKNVNNQTADSRIKQKKMVDGHEKKNSKRPIHARNMYQSFFMKYKREYHSFGKNE